MINVSNTIRVGGFATLDLLAEYHFNDRLTLRAKLANLFDEEYQTINTTTPSTGTFSCRFIIEAGKQECIRYVLSLVGSAAAGWDGILRTRCEYVRVRFIVGRQHRGRVG